MREIQVGKNRVFLDEDGILHAVSAGIFDEEMAIGCCDAMVELKNMSNGRVNYFVDLNNTGHLTSRVRKVFQQFAVDHMDGKLAFYGIHPVARVIATFFIGFAKKKDMRFFKNKEDALEWLRT